MYLQDKFTRISVVLAAKMKFAASVYDVMNVNLIASCVYYYNIKIRREGGVK